jgi:DNA-binding LacI/PurR family transcriptional regulator
MLVLHNSGRINRYTLFLELLRLGQVCLAFIANDYMAVPAMDLSRFGLGLRVPQDVSVIGFDDTVIASLPTYNLTTVRQPVSAMEDAALRLLFERIENRDTEPAHLVLRPL